MKSPSEAISTIGDILKTGEIFSGEIDKSKANFLFGKEFKITEVALVPLSCNSLTGVIALGTEELGKYNKDKDTIFLDFIAEVASKIIDNHNT